VDAVAILMVESVCGGGQEHAKCDCRNEYQSVKISQDAPLATAVGGGAKYMM
jgi:hypothetical protein